MVIDLEPSMRTDHPPRDKKVHLVKPSLWVAEPVDDSFLASGECLREREPLLWEGEHTEDGNSLIDKNGRL